MSNAVGRMQVLATLMLWICAGSIPAQDWPQWRGPNRDGKLGGFVAPQTWPKELTQRWKTTVGLGDSSPALVGGRLYVFGRQDANEVVQCLDAASGKAVWSQSCPADFVVTGPPSGHPGPRSTPVVANGKVCVLGVGGILSCLDAATGKVLWRKKSPADYMDTPYQFETSMSPVVVDGLCIVYIGGKGQGALMAFDLASGQAKWKCPGDAPSPSSPAIMTVAGVTQLVTLSESAVIGVSLADQSLLWRVPFKSRPVNSTTPVVDGQTVIVTGQAQGVGTLAITVTSQDGKFKAEQAWANTEPQAGSSFTTPVLRDGLLFGYAASKLVCLSAKTGQVLWADTIARGRSAAIVDAGSCLMALAMNGELTIYQPSDKAFIELAHYKVAEPEVWAHPVVAGKSLFIKDKDSVTCWTFSS